MYLNNSWYVACWSRELTDRPLAKKILDNHIVLYRTEKGVVAALEDRCPHRHLPLHMGTVVGERIQCGYHGMQLDRSGQCVLVPSQKAVPPRAQVRSYPVEERYGWIWIWTGEAALADASRIPDFSRLVEESYPSVGSTNHVLAAAQLVTDNLMDLSHVGFVHTSTIGTSEFGSNGQMKVEKTERGVRVTRWVLDCTPPPMYVKTGRLPPGVNIDRWQIIDYIAPTSVIIHVGGAETGTGAPEGKLAHGLNLWIMNAMTPESESETHYFWAVARDFGLGSEQLDELLFKEVSEAFGEDKAVLEAQQKVISRHGDSWANALQADAGTVESRRFLQRLIDAENVARDASKDAVSA